MAELTQTALELKEAMISTRMATRFGPEYGAQMARAIAGATAAISRLDARISVSSVAPAWYRRAAWSGYAKALQLQGAEIDEIDVFSWGCGLQVPGRPMRATHLDQFDRFDAWQASLTDPDPLAWRDTLPTAVGEPAGAADHPPLVRALERVRQHAHFNGGIAPWLGLPMSLRDARVSASPLPCLVGGVKGFRLKLSLSEADWLVAIRGIEASANAGLGRLQALERLYSGAQRAIAAEYRPGALPALLALTHHRPLLSPQSVATLLDLSVAGASKLLARAQAAGLLVEITQRATWRLFLTPDLAVEFGYVTPRRGRPRKDAEAPPRDRGLAAVFDAFDDEMARIDQLLGSRAAPPVQDDDED